MNTRRRVTGHLGAPAEAWDWLKAHMEERRAARAETA
jgi:hypothetical protein